MKKILCYACILFAGWVSAAEVNEESDVTMMQLMNNPQTIGKARYEYLFWDIYDAELVAPEGIFQAQGPFALKLTYLRDFKGQDIAKRSVDEMKKQGLQDKQKQQRWLSLMQQLFPDVKKHQSLTGLVDTDGYAHFFYDDDYLGRVDDQEFAQWFFNIWLGENTSDPKFRQALLSGVSA